MEKNKTIINETIIITIMIISLLILSGCTTKIKQPAAKQRISNQTLNQVTNQTTECTQDSDCGTGGCSGEICGLKKTAEKTITACIYKEEYSCLKLTQCKCINGKCAWEKTNTYKECIVKIKK